MFALEKLQVFIILCLISCSNVHVIGHRKMYTQEKKNNITLSSDLLIKHGILTPKHIESKLSIRDERSSDTVR